jgi:hypothetical protein
MYTNPSGTESCDPQVVPLTAEPAPAAGPTGRADNEPLDAAVAGDAKEP